jgi:multidrug efflux pump subunit AcrA (membrane-fusion protein)
VLLVAADGATQRREVTLGPGDLARVSVTRGLEAGDRVVLAPQTDVPEASPDAPRAAEARRAQTGD